MKLADAEQRSDLYPDRYLNVFVPYRSHLADANLTRAIVSTLRWARPELTTAFLKEFAHVEPKSAGAFHYDLKACDYEDFDPASVETQVILGISLAGTLATQLPPFDDAARSAVLLSITRAPLPEEVKLEQIRRVLVRPELDLEDLRCMAHTLEELQEGCLPDGWVFSQDAGVCVLIEAKLTERLDLYQLQRYAGVYYGREFGAEDMALTTWDRVAGFFADHRDDADPLTAFLCGQVHDYLDLLGLAPFNGFKPYDMDVDTMHEALPKFLKFVEAVRAEGIGRGLPLSKPRMSATGARLPFASDTLLGELRFDLLERGIRVELSLGDGLEGPHPGRGALDRLLELTQDGEVNPLAGQTLEDDLYVRLGRLRQERGQGEVFFDREVSRQPLDPDAFGELLGDLRLQHPPHDKALSAAGDYRQGLLAIGREVPRADALSPAKSLLGKTTDAAEVLTRLARNLVTFEEVEAS